MLSKTAEYALRTVACLAAAAPDKESADELSAQTKVPRRYLPKVLQGLVRAQLIESHSGPGGGYALALPGEQITILDVVNAVSPLERIQHCPLGLPTHTRLCPLHAELDRAYAATERSFSQVTIAQVLRSAGKIVPLCDAACS